MATSYITFQEVLKQIASNAANITSVTIKGNGRKIGDASELSVQGLTISKAGYYYGSVGSGTLEIYLDGGTAQWDGALTNYEVDPYFTAAQYNALDNLINKLTTYNSNIDIDYQI